MAGLRLAMLSVRRFKFNFHSSRGSMNTISQGFHQGRCLCGNIAYKLIGPPILLTICHCTFCQRATGSSFLVEPVWRDKDFELMSGQPKRYETRSRGSGKLLTVHFCDNCGTKIFQIMERFPGVIGIYGGTLDQPEIASTARETWRIFIDEAPKGTIIPPGVDVWRRHRLGNDGSPAQALRYDEFHTI